MKIALISVLLTLSAALLGSRAAMAAEIDAGQGAGSPVVALQADEAAGEDDDVVEVQLVVLGIVIGTVFVVGTGAFLLRRRLGLTAYTPPADSGHH